jgi:hypothetical protein
MGKVIAVIVAGGVGFVVAGVLGMLVGQAPVFHWELAGLVLAIEAAVAGLVAGVVGAASGRIVVGACVGVLIGGAGFALAKLGQQQPPALMLWGIVAAAAAAAVAGGLGGAIGRSASRTLPG